MKEIFQFRNFLRNNPYDKEHFNLREMFKIYSSYGISSMKDFSGATNDFLDTLLRCTDCIQFNSAEDFANFNFDLSEFAYSLHKQLDNFTELNHDHFTKVVSKLAPSKNNTRLLDVGSGEIPVSSMVFAKDFNDVTTMDRLLLSNPCLRNFNVRGKDEYFKDDTNIQNYDFIVGQRPCSAIESIVKNASKNNTPYFIELCYCDLGKIAAREGKYKGWEEILPEYDSNIQFYKNFAFNVDATPEQVGSLLSETVPPKEFLANEQVETLCRVFFSSAIDDRMDLGLDELFC